MRKVTNEMSRHRAIGHQFGIQTPLFQNWRLKEWLETISYGSVGLNTKNISLGRPMIKFTSFLWLLFR